MLPVYNANCVAPVRQLYRNWFRLQNLFGIDLLVACIEQFGVIRKCGELRYSRKRAHCFSGTYEYSRPSSG